MLIDCTATLFHTMTASVANSEPAVDSLREAFFRHAQALLTAADDRDDAWRAARACLHQRGFDLRKLEHLPIGYFPAAEPIWQRLLHDGFSADEIRASDLLADSRLPGRIVGPIRDAGRQIHSFWARQPENLDRCLYLSTDWKEHAGLFGLDVALPAVRAGAPAQRVGSHDLLVVEDLWDALLLQARGWAAVGAVGNSPAEIGPPRWERLDELGIHRVTLMVDSFHDSHEAALAAIRQAACSRRGPAIYVLPPAAVHGAWQSWQQGRAAQLDVLEKLLAAQRVHGFHYLALSLIALAKGDGPWTDAARRAALAEGGTFFAAAHQRNVPQLNAFFLPPLLDALGLNWSDHTRWSDSWREDEPSTNGSQWGDANGKVAGALQRRPLRKQPIQANVRSRALMRQFTPPIRTRLLLLAASRTFATSTAASGSCAFAGIEPSTPAAVRWSPAADAGPAFGHGNRDPRS